MMKIEWKNLLTAILLLAGLSGGSVQAADPIKIGAFLTVTSPASFLGDPELKTLQQLIHYDTGGNRVEIRNGGWKIIQ